MGASCSSSSPWTHPGSPPQPLPSGSTASPEWPQPLPPRTYTLSISLRNIPCTTPGPLKPCFCLHPFCFSCIPYSFTLLSMWQTPMSASRPSINIILSVKDSLSLWSKQGCFSPGFYGTILKPLLQHLPELSNFSVPASISSLRTLWEWIPASFIPISSECSTGLRTQKVQYKYLLNRTTLEASIIKASWKCIPGLNLIRLTGNHRVHEA